MSYNLCFLLCAVFLGIAACMSVWRYIATGESKYMKITARVSVGIMFLVVVSLVALCLMLPRNL